MDTDIGTPLMALVLLLMVLVGQETRQLIKMKSLPMSERGLEIKRFGGFENLSAGIAMHIQQRPCCNGVPDFEKATKRTAHMGEIAIPNP